MVDWKKQNLWILWKYNCKHLYMSAFYFSNQGDIKMLLKLETERMMQMDIYESNNATMDMAIADFFHSKNILDHAVKSNHYKVTLVIAKIVVSGFNPPLSTYKTHFCEFLELDFNITNNQTTKWYQHHQMSSALDGWQCKHKIHVTT